MTEVHPMSRPKVLRIPCKDKTEAESISRALEDPATRAFVVIVGTLLPFGQHARTRILSFVNDKLDEEAGRVTIETRTEAESGMHIMGKIPVPQTGTRPE